MNHEERLKQLRLMFHDSQLDGWLIPRADEHQGEYVAEYAQRLAWTTGFTGSAGLAIALKKKAAIFVDGRYILQAQKEVNDELYEIYFTGDKTPGQWLAEHAADLRIGYDPWLHTENEIERYTKATRNTRTVFVPHLPDLVDEIWHDQPEKPTIDIVDHPTKYAGESREDKHHRLANTMNENHIDVAVITNLDSVAWLMNIRGNDIPCTPVTLASALLYANGSINLFIDRKKVPGPLRVSFGSKVTLYEYKDFGFHLTGLNGKRVTYDPKTAPIQVMLSLQKAGAQLAREDDICLMPKACKNPVELEGMRQAHIRDGAALTQFLAWLYININQRSISESEAEKKLLSYRKEQKDFKDISFETISAAGPNGAIIHYRVSSKTDRILHKNDIYLIDSGGQYLDGTTDVTRTVAFHPPDADRRDKYTRVLKGHIAIASAVFPHGTTGGQLDTLARQFLWEAGVDYHHGTGHGVGSYLCVHEGPQRISKAGGDCALLPGMILSNEPGYYEENSYGIRIESLIIVSEIKIENAQTKMYGFETITMAPLCREFIELSLLTDYEKEWINTYHNLVRAKLTPLVDPATVEWLKTATAPL